MSDDRSTILPAPADLDPPIAQQRPYSSTHHGITLEDPYHWLKDPGYPEVTDTDVLDYLKAENTYFETVMAPAPIKTKRVKSFLMSRRSLMVWTIFLFGRWRSARPAGCSPGPATLTGRNAIQSA